MKTIVEPKAYIAKLWGKQDVRDDDTYRLMRYVLRVDYKDNVLLHNVITGQLVKLDQDEIVMMGKLPLKYCDEMEQLIDAHYLVYDQYNEHDQVVKMRQVLGKLDLAESYTRKTITKYTILPTTACNARCYYCYEKGIPTVTMSEKTADDTVKFIAEHCGNDKVSIRWFGGEPTVAVHRIDQICNGLHNMNVAYSSTMTTNGYLFDEKMASKAKLLWNLKYVMICVDGTEKNYNEIKAYQNVKDNPYQRVLRNIGLLLEQGISVSLRMNFDLGNYTDFADVLAEARNRFQGNKLLQVYAFPVNGEYPDRNGTILHGSDEWFEDTIPKLNDAARESGLFLGDTNLPSLYFTACKAGDAASMVIGPKGDLARCTGIFNRKDQIVGNVCEAFDSTGYYETWREFADPPRCKECAFFPKCVLIEKCPGKDRCFRKETYRQSEETIKMVFDKWAKSELKGDREHV